MNRGRGRPFGSRGTCSFCGETGHYATGGACSRLAVALRFVDEDRMSPGDAAREAGVLPQNLSAALRRRNEP